MAVPAGLPEVRVLPADRAEVVRMLWVMEGDHSWALAGSTGSMRPYLVGGELLLMEKYRGQPLAPHMLLVFARWDKPRGVVHECVDVRGDWFKGKGLHCIDADGWYPRERIKFIVRGVVRVDTSTFKAAGMLAVNTQNQGEVR